MDEVIDKEVDQVEYEYAVAIKFRGTGKPYSFGCDGKVLEKGDWVVVETMQGYELGQCEEAPLPIKKYGLHMPTKPVIRKANGEDHKQFQKNIELEKEAYEICNKEIMDLGLEMNLLNAQYTLDRSKILFIYLADQRVDFRELLKRLGAKLKCRIELRQIGERDQAKMVGGIGMCGMELCCCRYKTHFDVISINMAKNQLLALNIDKLSGMCGKLKCCLKYEDDDYKSLIEGLPKMGSQVEYEGEIYRITNMNVMSKEAKLENHETAIFITLDDLREKAIPRKGVVMKPKSDEKVVRKTVIHTNKVEEKKEEDRVLNMNTKTEVRSFGKKKDNHNRRNNNEHRNNQRRHEEPAKNVTVRTFGKKKKENEDK